MYKRGVFLLLFILAPTVLGLEDDDYIAAEFSPIKENAFVMFYKNMCDHCINVYRIWDTLTEIYKEENNNIQFIKVNCDTSTSLCPDHDLTGYPNLGFLTAEGGKPLKYKGTYDLLSITAFINEQLSRFPSEDIKPRVPEAVNGLLELTEDTFDKHVSTGHHFIKFYAPWCSHCQQLAVTWEELANSLRNDKSVSIAQVDCTAHRSLCEQSNIKGYPSLLWFEDGKKVDKYTDKRSHEKLKAYVSMMLGKSASKSDEKDDEKDENLDNNIHSVLALTGGNFEHGIKEGISFIEFFAPWCGHCKRLASTWESLGKKFLNNHRVNIVKVDCTLDTSKQLCNEQEVDGFPTLLLYQDGYKVTEYNGSRTLEDLYEFVMNHLNESHDEL